MSPAVTDARLRRLARRVHRLGERPLYELFPELAAGADPIERIERYAALPPDFIAAFGGAEMPPVRLVASGRNLP